MSLPVRPGMTVPLPGPLHTHRQGLVELADLMEESFRDL